MNEASRQATGWTQDGPRVQSANTWLLVNTLKMCSSESGAKPWHSLILAMTPATKVPWPKPAQKKIKATSDLRLLPSTGALLPSSALKATPVGHNVPQLCQSLTHLTLVSPEFIFLSSHHHQESSHWSSWFFPSRS